MPMTKTALVAAIAESCEVKKSVASTALSTLASIATEETKKNGKFVVPGLVMIKTRKKPATKGPAAKGREYAAKNRAKRRAQARAYWHRTGKRKAEERRRGDPHYRRGPKQRAYAKAYYYAKGKAARVARREAQRVARRPAAAAPP